MYTKFFFIPKAVYYMCFLPSALIIIGCLLFYIIYRKKKNGTYYYNFTINYVLELGGLFLATLLISLVLGYSFATISTIYILDVINKYTFFLIILVLMPFIPIGLFIYLAKKFKDNLKYKEELDKNLKNI